LAKIAAAEAFHTNGFGLALCGEISLDGGLQVDDRMKTVAANVLACQHREEVRGGLEKSDSRISGFPRAIAA
jgi:hypothetical protein